MNNSLPLASMVLLLFACGGFDDQHATQRYIDNLYMADTLVISGIFDDCGERGGHHEYIKLYQDDWTTAIEYIYQKDKVDCSDPLELPRTLVEQKSGELNASQESQVVHFINDMIVMSFGDEGFSDSANYFRAELKDEEHRRSSMPKLRIEYANYGPKWNGFDALVVKLLTTSSD